MSGKTYWCFILIWMTSTHLVQAQQEAQFTQYMYNTSAFNPAYAGSRECLSILGMHRSQWVGLEGAPTTNVFAAHSPIHTTKLLGLGVSFVNDQLGPSQENTISVDLSYAIPTSEKYKLAFGIKATANFFNVNFNKLTSLEGNDPLSFGRQNIDQKFYPNIGVGAYWYSNNTYFGVSIPYMLEQKYYDNSVQFVASEKKHFYVMSGHVFPINNQLQFKPAFLVKMSDGAPLQVDFSGNFWWNEKVSLGIAYRLGDAVSALAGFQLSTSWLIGYAYDKEVTRLGNFTSGSHEIFLRYEFRRVYSKFKSPRFF